jgi:hypothetical protein
MSDNQDVCILCMRPIKPGDKITYMGHLLRDAYAHKACYDERYHPERKAEREAAQEKQAAMFAEEAI